MEKLEIVRKYYPKARLRECELRNGKMGIEVKFFDLGPDEYEMSFYEVEGIPVQIEHIGPVLK